VLKVVLKAVKNPYVSA